MGFASSRPPASYLVFTRNEWAALRASMPLPVTDADLDELRGLNDPVSLADVTDIYLPLSRLLNLQVTAAHSLSTVIESAFLGRPQAYSTFIIAIAGSVAVGKSTFARLLQAVLGHWPDRPRVDLVTTDGFLYPTEILQQRDLMRRKGFPESYDLRRMIAFLEAVKAGETDIRTPVYSHEIYDIVPGQFQTINRPHILIFEGLNVLQTISQAAAVASDFFDFSIYLDADPTIIEAWYLERFLLLHRKGSQRPSSFMYRYRDRSREQAEQIGSAAWRNINLPNLLENIQPTRERADLVIRKGSSHDVEELWLRRP
jgi:type I pantothenate kinase